MTAFFSKMEYDLGRALATVEWLIPSLDKEDLEHVNELIVETRHLLSEANSLHPLEYLEKYGTDPWDNAWSVLVELNEYINHRSY